MVFIYTQGPIVLERFQTTGNTTDSNATPTTVAIPANYIETSDTTTNFSGVFPQSSSLFAYVSSFSRRLTRTNTDMDVFSSGSLRWYDMKNTNDFNLQTSKSLPSSLISGSTVNGLPLKDVKMENISQSDRFGSDPNNGVYTLGTISACFYMKWNAVNATTSDMILLELFAETPNYVCMRFKNVTAAQLTMEVIIGNVSTSYTWTIPVLTLLSNGNKILISLVYNAANNTISVFLGVTEYKMNITSATSIILSNSKLAINSNKNIDATLYAFAFFKGVALTKAELLQMNEYFEVQSRGNSAIIGQIKGRLEEITGENARLRDELDAARTLTCPTEPNTANRSDTTSAPVSSYAPWKINTNFPTEGISTTDLSKCSPMDIREFGEAKTESPLEKQLPPDLASATNATMEIVNPTRPQSSSSTPAPVPGMGTTSQSNASTTTTSSINNNLIDELRRQISLTNATSANVATTPATTPINDSKDVNAVQQVSFFQFISKYL